MNENLLFVSFVSIVLKQVAAIVDPNSSKIQGFQVLKIDLLAFIFKNLLFLLDLLGLDGCVWSKWKGSYTIS